MTDETPLESDGTLYLHRCRDSATGKDFAVHLGSDAQLERLQGDLQAQHDGFRTKALEFLTSASEMFARASNALSGANMIAFELDVRANEKKMWSSAASYAARNRRGG